MPRADAGSLQSLILSVLARGEATNTMLAHHLGRSAGTISSMTSKMFKAGLIDSEQRYNQLTMRMALFYRLKEK